MSHPMKNEIPAIPMLIIAISKNNFLKSLSLTTEIKKVKMKIINIAKIKAVIKATKGLANMKKGNTSIKTAKI